MKATFQLMQDSGVQGPRETVEISDSADTRQAARAWADGQTGHPWDRINVEIDGGPVFDVETKNMERTNLRPHKDVILTAGGTCQTTDGTWQQIYGIFDSEEDARSGDADDLAIGTVVAKDLTEDQRAMAERNTAAMLSD